MNIHFVALRKRNNFLHRLLSAVNSVGYRLRFDDHVYVYTNLCLTSADILALQSELRCNVYLQPLSSDEDVALRNLPDVVLLNARCHPDDANVLIDNDGVCKRGHVVVIPSYSSQFRG